MKIAPDTIKSLLSGAVRFQEDGNGIMPLRYTEDQSRHYQMSPKVCASAGMRLDFITDARQLKLCGKSICGSSRKFCYFDVYVDGILIRHCGTENREKDPDVLLETALDGALHHVQIYLPNLAGFCIREMNVKIFSLLTPVKRPQKLLAFGDSITQGYDARHPSFSYINRVADHFNWELINKAYGGEIFRPEMGTFKENFVPDHIFVAYGTNDWSNQKRGDVEHAAWDFFRNLRANFPETPINILLPIWRADSKQDTAFGNFNEISEVIRVASSPYSKVRIIDGLSLFPRQPEFFADGYLHPNDMGSLLLAEKLIAAMNA